MWGSVVALGVTQGFTEFLPISSSGHLILLKTLFGVAASGAEWEVALHVGTLVAVLWIYRAWLRRWVRQLLCRDRDAWRLFAALAVASLPAGAVGMLLGRWIEQFFLLPAAALGWCCTAMLLWAAPVGERAAGRPLSEITLWQAWLIGLAQALSLWPGLSRSGSTIAMARILGIDGESAAQFSFLMAIPAVIGAALFEWPLSLTRNGVGIMLSVGVLVAAISGAIAIQWVRKLMRHPWAWRGFSVYVAGLAIVSLWFGGAR
ncbi:MAG: undecaprenyl-diphosphate phosphatase [Firmicutes bacterium]|nr:undecaprenyl-diphosphate phosphatase [Bacillota bacterium]